MASTPRLFGTDGIRGRANEGLLTPEGASAFGCAVATKFGPAGGPLIIGRDTRESGPMLEAAVASGAASIGIDVLLLGVVPTPAVAFLTRRLKGCAGVVISASHNSYEDNGLKIFRGDGYKCDDALEIEIEALIRDPSLRCPAGFGAKRGKIESWPQADTRYAEMMAADYRRMLDLSKVSIVVDAANGAACKTTPDVLRGLGAKVTLLHAEPDGININADCGSTHPESMLAAVKKCGAQIGLAHDGDADRLLVCDETGSLLDGDEMLAIIALNYLERDRLAGRTLVATVMSNLGLDECLAAAGGKVLRCAVGDRYVLEALLEHDLNVGGEQSGHVILRDYNTTGDGLVTALEILRIMRDTGRPLSQLRLGLRKYPQKLVNLRVQERIPLDDLPGVKSTLSIIETELGASGRVLLRYSGTEAKLRLLVETRDPALLQPIVDRVMASLGTDLKILG